MASRKKISPAQKRAVAVERAQELTRRTVQLLSFSLLVALTMLRFIDSGFDTPWYIQGALLLTFIGAKPKDVIGVFYGREKR